ARYAWAASAITRGRSSCTATPDRSGTGTDHRAARAGRACDHDLAKDHARSAPRSMTSHPRPVRWERAGAGESPRTGEESSVDVDVDVDLDLDVNAVVVAVVSVDDRLLSNQAG